MYRIVKMKGHSANVVVENTDTKSNIIIGKISIEMLNILEKAGHKIGEGETSMDSAWNIRIDMDTASKLAKLTMKIKKPIREQKKEEIIVPQKDTKQNNKRIDAMDVLLGLANYN